MSGYMYRSAVLYYDRETESFWSQMTGACVVGPGTGKQLAWLPTRVTSWDSWRTEHPKTTVLAPVADMRRYRGTEEAYRRYRATGMPVRAFLGDVVRYPDTYKPMDRCTIVGRGKEARCYPHPALPAGETKDGARTITRAGEDVVVRDAEGAIVPSLQGFWFAFFAFYPDGTVWAPPKKKPEPEGKD